MADVDLLRFSDRRIRPAGRLVHGIGQAVMEPSQLDFRPGLDCALLSDGRQCLAGLA